MASRGWAYSRRLIFIGVVLFVAFMLMLEAYYWIRYSTRHHDGHLVTASVPYIVETRSNVVGTVASADDEKYPPEVQKIIDGILAAKSPLDRIGSFDKEKSYHTLFKKVGVDGLKKLQSYSDDSIALQAAWEQVELSVPVELYQKDAWEPDRKMLASFSVLLENRCKLKAPAWWSACILHANANRRYNIYFPDPKNDVYHEAGLDSVKAPLNTTLHRNGSKLMLRIEKDIIEFPHRDLSTWSDGKYYDNVSALLTPSRCYYSVHGNTGHSYHLKCIDRATGKEVWQSKVWGHWWGVSTGISMMWVAITEQDNRIIVFGMSGIGFHVEGFRVSDGKNLFRVSNAYGF